MNEPVNRRHMSTGAAGRGGQGDPLAELARIVGNNDPFADLFNEARGTPIAAPVTPPPRKQTQSDLFDTPLRGSLGPVEGDGWHDTPTAPARRPMAEPQSHYSGDGDDYGTDEAIDAARYEDYPEEAYAPEDPYEGGRHPRTAPRRGLGAIGVTLLVLLAAGGAGAYAVKSGSISIVGGGFAGLGTAAPPVIKASADPVKIKPAAAATVAAAAQPTKEIFGRVGDSVAPEPEKIVSREELPLANVPKKVQSIKIETGPAPADPAPDATGTTAIPVQPLPVKPLPTRDIATVPAITFPQAAPAAKLPDPPQVPTISQTTQEPRKVRTIKVLADNSYVTGEAPALPTRSLDSPAAPAQELAATPPTAVVAPVLVAPEPPPAAAPLRIASADPVAPIPDALPVEPVKPLASRGIELPQASPAPTPAAIPPLASRSIDLPIVPAPSDAAVDAPEPVIAPLPALPPVRPKDIPIKSVKLSVVDQNGEPVAPAKPAPVKVASAEPEAPVAAPVSSGGFVVQVSSQKSQADAMSAWQSLQRKYSAVVGGLKPSIKKAEVGDRGTFYRVRVGPWASSSDAAALCAKLKAAGGDCVVARN